MSNLIKSMTPKSNVIILESQKGFSTKLREYFQSKGFSSHAAMKLSEIQEEIYNLANPIMLIELPDRLDATNKLIAEILENKALHAYPLILVGKTAKFHEPQLNEKFKMALTYNKPVNNAELKDAVTQILANFQFPQSGQVGEGVKPPSRSFEVQGAKSVDGGSADGRSAKGESAQREGVTGQKTAAKGQGSTDQAGAGKPTEIIEIDQTIPANELYASFNSIPQLFFDEVNKYNLLSKDLQGQKYITFSSEESIEYSDMLNSDPKMTEVFKDMFEKLPKSLAVKIHRVNFLSKQIISALCDDPQLIENAKAAGILFNWSLTKEQKIYLKKDYIALKSKAFRRDLCSKVKDSAVKCAVDLAQNKIAEIISKIGKLIGREEEVSNDPVSIAASTIAAVDMIDRACWQSNHFSSRAAYKVMVMAKTGQLSEMHPAVLCCIIKVLSEALASNIKVFLIPRKMRKDPELMKAAQATRDLVAGEGEKKVEIDKLTPGMRLSRPLIAFDGREILEGDMVLDQDLIWRIWQLSLVRPLNAPLVIEK